MRSAFDRLLERPLRMWVWLDRLGVVLIDATLSTTIVLSLIVLPMLLCHQPKRRVIIEKAAILLTLIMLPLAAASPLPRFSPIAWLRPFASVAPDPTEHPVRTFGDGNGALPEGKADAESEQST